MSKEKLEAIRDITVAYIQTIFDKHPIPAKVGVSTGEQWAEWDKMIKQYDDVIYRFVKGLNEVLSEVISSQH